MNNQTVEQLLIVVETRDRSTRPQKKEFAGGFNVAYASIVAHHGFSFHPRMKPIPRHTRAAVAGFCRA